MHVTTIWNTTRPREMRFTRAVRVAAAAVAQHVDDVRARRHPGGYQARNDRRHERGRHRERQDERSTSNVIHDGGGFSRPWTVADSQSVDTYARPTPTVAPMVARSRLSVSICRWANDILCRAALGFAPFALTPGFVDEAHVALLVEALERIGAADTALRVRLLGSLATALYWSDRRPPRRARRAGARYGAPARRRRDARVRAVLRAARDAAGRT